MVLGGRTRNVGSGHSPPCCPADYNQNGTVQIADIFASLNDWFAGSRFAKVGGDGSSGTLAVADIFSFLNRWFSGC